MLKLIERLMWAALIGFIAYFITFVICQGTLDAMNDNGGIILASEQVSLKYTPIGVGILVFLTVLFYKDGRA